MTVVTDTSVILNLCLIGLEELLPRLFGQVIAPSEVVAAFQRLSATDARFSGLIFPASIEIAAPTSIVPLLRHTHRLQKGEVAAISLAIERKASVVLMDERAGRAAAVELGLKPIGLLGLLVEARRRSLVPAIAPLIDRLEIEGRFWIGASLRSKVLRTVGEAMMGDDQRTDQPGN